MARGGTSTATAGTRAARRSAMLPATFCARRGGAEGQSHRRGRAQQGRAGGGKRAGRRNAARQDAMRRQRRERGRLTPSVLASWGKCTSTEGG